jgi:3-methyladenine DNA glycosylase AlkD
MQSTVRQTYDWFIGIGMAKAYDLLLELEVIGTEKNRKIYRRHGVCGYQFGVSFANLKNIARRVGLCNTLAEMLWCSSVYDARMLATMVADAQTIREELLDRWSEDLDNSFITDAFSGLVARTRFARRKADVWSTSTDEWVGAAGWNLVADLARHNHQLDNDYFIEKLERIASEINERLNCTRYSMNNALIAIGRRNSALQEKALVVADRIGKVGVDHGEMAGKTPDARTSI